MGWTRLFRLRLHFRPTRFFCPPPPTLAAASPGPCSVPRTGQQQPQPVQAWSWLNERESVCEAWCWRCGSLPLLGLKVGFFCLFCEKQKCGDTCVWCAHNVTLVPDCLVSLCEKNRGVRAKNHGRFCTRRYYRPRAKNPRGQAHQIRHGRFIFHYITLIRERKSKRTSAVI